MKRTSTFLLELALRLKLQLPLLFLPFIFFSTLYSQDEFAAGAGTAEEPWLIATAEHLNNVRNYLGEEHDDKHFRQIDDINLGVDPWNTGEGWAPIGIFSENGFTGTYKGGGHRITDLYINRPNAATLEFQGLFGYAVGANIDSLNIINHNITGNSWAGALAGYIDNTTITACHSSGDIKGQSSTIGGLIGQAQNNSIITHCSTRGTVRGESDVGGLIGRATHGCQVSESYSICNVHGTGFQIGGLAGVNFTSVISNCYALGNLTGSGARVAGLVGWMSEGSSIINSYSTGSVTGSSALGGLLGVIWRSSSTSSYWDTETSGMSTSAAGFGRTTEQMQQKTNYTGWDFSEIWDMEEGESYPWLRWQGKSTGHNYTNLRYRLSVNILPVEGGSVLGEGLYPDSANVQLTANANPGYTFVSWTDDQGNPLGDEPELLFTMPPEDVTLTANFEIKFYDLDLNVTPEGAGTVEGAGSYAAGTEVTLSATPAEGYQFLNWTDAAGNPVELTNGIFTMPPEDVTLTANFKMKLYDLDLNVTPEGAGTVEGAGSYPAGTEVTLSASPAEGYQFLNWTDAAGNPVELTNGIFTMPPEDVTLTANFDQIVGIDRVSLSSHIQVYPNPGNGIVYFEYRGKEIVNLDIEVLSITGSTVYNTYLQGVDRISKTIDLQNLGKGVFFMRINEAGTVKTIKLIIN